MLSEQEIWRNLKVNSLTPMQEAMERAWGQDADVVLLSPTGSGKTLAYLLPLAQSLRADVDGVQAVVLVPSRELALQTEQVFRQMGVPFQAMSCYGGRPAADEHRVMQRLHPAVIVGTPGRMNDHLGKLNFNPETVTTLVIDEFDKSLELGFREEMSRVIGALPSIERRVLLSATDTQDIPKFTGVAPEGGRHGGKCLKLDFREEGGVSARVEMKAVYWPQKDKLEALLRLLCQTRMRKALVFVNYRESVERVTGYLQAKRFPCDMFHGGMEQPLRERALYKFINGTCPVLVCTDLASRGLDVPEVDGVVHYHLPVNEEAFIHRNGRTARWEATGRAFVIVGPEEQLPGYMDAQMEREDVMGAVPPPPRPEWATVYMGLGKKDKLSRADVVGFLYKKGGLDRDDLGRVDVKDRYTFAAVRRHKVKQMLQLVAREKIKGMRTIVEEAR